MGTLYYSQNVEAAMISSLAEVRQVPSLLLTTAPPTPGSWVIQGDNHASC